MHLSKSLTRRFELGNHGFTDFSIQLVLEHIKLGHEIHIQSKWHHVSLIATCILSILSTHFHSTLSYHHTINSDTSHRVNTGTRCIDFCPSNLSPPIERQVLSSTDRRSAHSTALWSSATTRKSDTNEKAIFMVILLLKKTHFKVKKGSYQNHDNI